MKPAWLLLLSCGQVFAAAGLSLEYDQPVSGPEKFAGEEIVRAAGETGWAIVTGETNLAVGTTRVELAVNAKLETNAVAQSYQIRVQNNNGQRIIMVRGADAVGAMYGGLDVAEAIRTGALDSLTNSDHKPRILERGIKFNIPLDRRTPTYSDDSDSAQKNIPEMWSMDFWHAFLDDLARSRFNVLSLWNLHPFPSLVKVPEYPGVALNDVWGQKPGTIDYGLVMNSHDMAKPFKLGNVAVVKKMTIEEKIQFWREVMQYAKDRGVDVYLFTWNIFVWGTEGKYGLTEDGKNRKTIPYLRDSVRELVKTYPLLAGIGITAGENMRSKQGEFDHETWLWQTYGEGVRDALKDDPSRKIRFIHRYHEASQADIIAKFKELPGIVDFSLKYSGAHMYSVPNPSTIKPVLPALPPDRRVWLEVRNDDIYSFRWGNADFARAYVHNIPGPDKVAGFNMGPDGYCWGREFIDREPESPRQLVMEKQWYSFMLWGRLSYEPDLPDAIFERALAARFPQVAVDKLFAASAAASEVFPQISRFFCQWADYQWFPEACLYRGGFYSVKDFAEGSTSDVSGMLNIRQWRARVAEGKPMDGITPLQVAATLKGNAEIALALVAELRPLQGDNKELRLMLGDDEAMARLGNYYAEKILGAADLALYDQSGKPEQQASAIGHLEAALAQWKKYAAVTASQYQPQRLGRLAQTVNVTQLTDTVAKDIEIAKTWKLETLKRGVNNVTKESSFRP